MSRRLVVRPEAEAEMADAFDWYEERAPGLGSEFLRCVDAVFSAIMRAPQQYPRVHKIVHRALMRRFPYAVFFWRTPTESSLCRFSMLSETRNDGGNAYNNRLSKVASPHPMRCAAGSLHGHNSEGREFGVGGYHRRSRARRHGMTFRRRNSK